MYWRTLLTCVALFLTLHAAAQLPQDPAILIEKSKEQLLDKPFPPELLKSGTAFRDVILKDKVSLINLWYVGCFWCLEEIPYLHALIDSVHDDRFQVISFARNTKEELDTWFADTTNRTIKLINKLNGSFKYKTYPCCSESYKVADTGKCMLTEDLGIIVYPTTLIVDKKGIVRYYQVGFSAPARSIKDGLLFKEDIVRKNFEALKAQVNMLLNE